MDAAPAYTAAPSTRSAGDFRITVKDFAPGARLGRHCDPGGSICVVLSGRVSERDARQQLLVEAGGALFRPADQPHSDQVDCRGARVVTVSASPAALATLGRHRLRVDRPVASRSADVAATGARLQQALADEAPGTGLILEGLSLELFGRVLRGDRAPHRPWPPRWLDAVRERLDAEPQRAYTLQQLSRQAGVSSAHLASSFRARYGESVGEFLRRTRVEAASRRLASGDEPLAEIAVACGFCDQSHLTRVFRRHTGLTPGAWRRAARGR